MQPSSPTYTFPSTPIPSRTPLQHKPLNSSPLAPPQKMSSPLQARRRSQYKPQMPSTPSSAGRFLVQRRSSATSTPLGADEDPQKAFLRSRLKARCLERAFKARENAIKGRRAGTLSEPSSDDIAMDDDDDEEDDDDIMQDELFRRIMANVNQKERHSYRVSYAQEVGSSFDPDIEDIHRWEEELTASNSAAGSSTPSGQKRSTDPSEMPWMDETEQNQDEYEPSPDDIGDLDDEELEAYAEEYTRQAAVADFEDIPLEDLLTWSEDEEFAPPSKQTAPRCDEEMDMS